MRVPCTTFLRSSAFVRASRLKPSTRDQSPMYIDGAYCAWRQPIRSRTRGSCADTRSSSIWRARRARLSCGCERVCTGVARRMYRRRVPKGTSPVRLALFYALLAAAVTLVAALVVSEGEDKTAQPAIAGGYDLAAPNACLGEPPPPARGKPLPPTAPPQPLVGGPS